MNFVRNKTRLNGDIYAVIRSLTNHDKINKWTKTSPTEITRFQDQRVDWKVAFETEKLTDCQFYLMRCASKTEFCTEVHLVSWVSNDDVEQNVSQNVEQLDAFSKELLEELRCSYNKTWVIGDNELNASMFKESF